MSTGENGQPTERPEGPIYFTEDVVKGAAGIFAAMEATAEVCELEPAALLMAATLALARLCSVTELGTVSPAVFGKTTVIAFEGELERLLNVKGEKGAV